MNRSSDHTGWFARRLVTLVDVDINIDVAVAASIGALAILRRKTLLKWV
ncbi:MAG TPA: hypothetical protein VGR53_03660 [Nitrososphaerales archaeon]|nr:hypothetical protein [Nitrososphaerales archaeon]